jgi:succinyl-CoA synthetase beta subunit
MARLLEHHALDLLKQGGVPVPPFRVISSSEAAREAAGSLGGHVVLKALIPAGGRGKAGAIKMALTPDEAFDQARGLLGRTILNFPVRELLVSEMVKIAKEFFVSLTFDSMSRKPLFLLSSLGGVDVETILEKDPDRLVQIPVDICIGLQPFQAREIAESVGLKGKILMEAAQMLTGLYRVFRQFDA